MYLRLSLIFLISVLFMTNLQSSTIYDNPIYFIEYEVYNVESEIFLNGIVISKDSDQGKTVSEIPVPEYIINGQNSIQVDLSTKENIFDGTSYINLSLIVKDRADVSKTPTVLLNAFIQPGVDSKERAKKTTIKDGQSNIVFKDSSNTKISASTSINIQTNHNAWAWENGQLIENNDANYQSLLKEYIEIHTAMSNKDTNRIKSMYDAAAMEYATAYNHTDINKGHKIMNTFGFFDDPEWAIADANALIKNMDYRLHVYANGKLANIIETEHNKSPIMFVENETQNLAFLKFMFYKNKNGNWIMIR